MIDLIPFWPPDDPFWRRRSLPEARSKIIMDDDHVLRIHLVVACQWSNGFAAGVHVRQRLHQQHLIAHAARRGEAAARHGALLHLVEAQCMALCK